MITTLEISKRFEVAHSRIISLVEKLNLISEYDYLIEEYTHTAENNKREFRAFRMDDKFYLIVLLHLPPEKRVIANRSITNLMFGLLEATEQTKLSDNAMSSLNYLQFDSIEADRQRIDNMEKEAISLMFKGR